MSQVAASTGLFASSIPNKELGRPQEVRRPHPGTNWWEGTFANEQVRGLVRQLFLSEDEKHSQHILFSAIDRETDAGCVCRLVGEALAQENVGDVAVFGRSPQLCPAHGVSSETRRDDHSRETAPLRQASSHVAENLWVLRHNLGDRLSITTKLHSAICDLRREFEYSIIEGPVADSHEALTMAQMVDGVVLVLSARHTRRATALTAKRALESAHARILGTVLIDRVFPIPENIYRRL